MLPKAAIVDPKPTIELPPAITASTGADALTQLIEPFVSVRANPLVDAICRDGMTRAARALPRVFVDGRDVEARTEMSLVSLYGGLALANAGLGAAHGFASPIGGMFDAPHGAVCAALLPHVMEVNIEALAARVPAGPGNARYEEVARILTGNPKALARDGVAWSKSLIRELQIPPLHEYGIKAADIPAVCDNAAASSSMKANPIALTRKELYTILERAL
jgi:alcohol dehydrogenase class IV